MMFGNMASYELKTKQDGEFLPLWKLLHLYFSKNHVFNIEQRIHECLEVLIKNADLLWDYFSIGILETEDGPVLRYGPAFFCCSE